jgi:RNA polymerase sigma-32 factor
MNAANNLQLQLIEKSLPIGSTQAYLRLIYKVPYLSKEEEQDLALKFHRDGDLNAARQLVLSHLRLVAHIAKGYLGYGLSYSDLIQEGNIGLMKAVKHFNPNVGVRLVSFAIHWIKAEIHEFILRNFRIVKIATTKAQRKLFFNLRKITKKIIDGHETSLKSINKIATALKVGAEDVRTMQTRLNSHDMPLENSSLENENGDDWQSPINYLEANEPDPAQSLENEDWTQKGEKRLATALSTLDTRSKNIIKERWLKEKKVTFEELATKYNVSIERVRQIEQAAFTKLKKALASA